MNFRKLITPIARFISQDLLLELTGRNIIFPYYHTISDVDLPYISNLYTLRSVDEFKKDLDYLCKHFEPLNIGDVRKRTASKARIYKPGFHLTFDDGLKEVFTVIAPILEERKIPATFFLNTDFIDNKRLFYRYKVGLILEKIKVDNGSEFNEILRSILVEAGKLHTNVRSSLLKLNYHDEKLIDSLAKRINLDFREWLHDNNPYLTGEQVKDLQERGFHIGSHSSDHPRFKNISLNEQKRQVIESFKNLDSQFNLGPRFFSFPFGDEEVSKEFFNWLYKTAECKLSFGVSGIKDDYSPFHLHRIPMDNCTMEVGKFIKSEYLYFMAKRIFNKNQIKRH